MVGPSLYCLSRAVNNLALKNGSQPNCLTVVVAGIAVSVATIAVVAAETIVAMAVAVTIAVAVTVGSIEKVGVSLSLSLPLAVVVAVAVVAVGGDGDGVLVDDGLASGVGDDGTGANGEGALAGIVDLAVEGGGREEGRDLMDGSLQLTVVTGNGLVASNSHWDWEVGGNNVGLNGGGDGLVGDPMWCPPPMRSPTRPSP